MMSRKMSSQSVLFLGLLLCSICNPCSSSEPKIGCVEVERQRLLNIKHDLRGIRNANDPLSSWGNGDEKRDCCKWLGVRCANKSGHVVGIDLSPSAIGITDFQTLPALEGKISPSLFELQYLNYLSFDFIDFTGSQIPSSMGTLTQLRYLSLSSTRLSGEIPPQLANLSRLEELYLRNNDSLTVKNLEWVSHLSSLRILDLSGTDMSRATDWAQRVNQLPSLTTLRLRSCYLPDTTYPSSLSFVNSSTSLITLDLFDNVLRSPIFPWLFNFSKSLANLDLSSNRLQGSIPEGFNKMTSLMYLNLYDNQLTGSIPEAFSNMTFLTNLDLHSNKLNGSIPEVFSRMDALRTLDLSNNELLGSVPKGFKNMTELESLSLDYNRLHGSIPEDLNKLTALRTLDLSNNELYGSIPDIFTKMSFLAYLDLSHNALNGFIPEDFSKMTSLTYIDLSHNALNGFIPEDFIKMASLTHLDLSRNQLKGSIPEDFGKMTSLTYFDLSRNGLNGSIPDMFWNMSNLNQLNLEDNMLEGELPRSFWNMSSLHELRVGSNNLSGHLPENMSQLKQLETFDVSRNFFQGEISNAHFSNLSKLTYLDLSSNSLSLNFHTNWTPPFQLSSILLGSCMLGPQFPKWLQTQRGYMLLNISNSGISDSIPNWLWEVSRTFLIMDLSNNQIRGVIGDNISLANYYAEIDLSSNQLEGQIPLFLSKVRFLNLLQNRFSKLNLPCNITSEMPLEFLDISNNELSEELPDCWSHFKRLRFIILTNNKLSGRVPSSIGSLNNILSLNLYNNKFTGELPSALKNCTELVVIDFGENNLSGTIPTWLGKSLSNLAILGLRSNRFYGTMPNSLCDLSYLQLLDLSFNGITGSIPKCMSSFTAMRKDWNGTRTTITLGSGSYGIDHGGYESKDYHEIVRLQWKGGLAEFRSILALVRSIDLSSNKLNGEIPIEITELTEIVSLNLSRNNLGGHIPAEIGHMKSLDILDFSWNHLVGKIPSSLAQIDRLSMLDLSYNNLSGKIPIGTQLQSFQATAYTGNSELCGAPLPKNCSDSEQAIPGPSDHAESDEFLNRGFYISMAIGFITAFWGVCGGLIFNKSFRYAYFKLLNDIGDLVYVKTAIQKAKLLRMIKG